MTGASLAAELIDALRAANPGFVLPPTFPARYGKSFKTLLTAGASPDLLRQVAQEMAETGYSDPKAIDSFAARLQTQPRTSGRRSPATSTASIPLTRKPVEQMTQEERDARNRF